MQAVSATVSGDGLFLGHSRIRAVWINCRGPSSNSDGQGRQSRRHSEMSLGPSLGELRTENPGAHADQRRFSMPSSS